MINPFATAFDHLQDAANALSELDEDGADYKRISEFAAKLETAIDAALGIAQEADDYICMDHEQAAEDHYWDQKIDEARGK